MSAQRSRIPQPVPLESLPPPEIPPHLRPPPPGPMQITQVVETDVEELAIIYKRTYAIAHDRVCKLAEEQVPLDNEGAFHDELAPGVAPSPKSLPEVIGLKTGTDVVVQGSARPPQPATEMQVAVEIGAHRHAADVIGQRFCDYRNGRLVFTPPEPFEAMPLRYENAYGGRDAHFEKALMDETRRIMPAEDWRRAKPAAEAMLKQNHPLMYPRNRFGKGYVVEDRREFIEGRELPNLERPDDRLTPERLVVGDPFDWLQQPIPVGFDYLDPLCFPRSALMAMPPASRLKLDMAQEAAKELIPPDFARGNLFAQPPEKLQELVHPAASRCASLGLWMPFLLGNEVILLRGMDPAIPVFCVRLPSQLPAFDVTALQPGAAEVAGQLHLVLIDVDQKTMNLVWVGRMPLPPRPVPGERADLVSAIRVRMRDL